MSKEIGTVDVFNSFKYLSGGEEASVRVAGTFENPLFCAKDVCSILGIGNVSHAISRLDPECRTIISNDTSAGRRNLSFITEEGLYDLLAESKKPIAKAFRKWLHSEVIPSIRKTGQYKVPNRREELDIVETGSRILSSIGMLDDRAKAMLASATYNLLCNNSTLSSGEWNSSEEEWSISRRVQAKLGRSLCTKRDKVILIEIGKEMSREYQARRNRRPPKRTQYIDGTLREVNHYTASDFEEFGDNLISAYF